MFSVGEIRNRFRKSFFHSAKECCPGSLEFNCFHIWPCVSPCRNMPNWNAWYLQQNSPPAANFEGASVLSDEWVKSNCWVPASIVLDCLPQRFLNLYLLVKTCFGDWLGRHWATLKFLYVVPILYEINYVHPSADLRLGQKRSLLYQLA